MNIEETQQFDPDYVRKNKFWKFWFIMSLITIGLILVVYRLLSIQVIDSEKYKEIAKKQHESKITLSSQRGKIFDRYGRLVASNLESISIAVDPTRLKNPLRLAELIQESLEIPKERILKKIRSAKGSFVWLARGIFPEKTSKIADLGDKGVILIKEPRRIYHYGLVCSQVVGFTDIDNNGLSGIELKHDSILKGRSGYMVMNRDGLGRLRPAADLPVFPAVDGYSLKLTIDIEFQRIVEYELMKGVESADAEAGTVIAIEPSTGEILAMATYPTYDPHLSSGEKKQGNMRMRAITDTYEPGSTFKIITAAAAMEEKLVKEEDKFNGYGGSMQFKNFVIRDVHGIGVVTFREAMEHSSNIIMSNVASMIPDYTFYKYLRDFGFGIRSGIDFPGEVPGKLPKPEDYNAASKRYMGFGYGLSVSPLQITNAYSTIANNGILMKPYLVKSMFDLEGNEVYSRKPEQVRRVISDSTAKRLNDMLKGVVNKGTGKSVRVDNLQVCGKTGTAQQIVNGVYSKSNYTASFAGFFPAENPKVAMIVVLDKPRSSIYGGAVAGPIFKNIALRWASVSDEIKSGNLLEYASIDTTIEKSDNYIVPNFIGKNRAEALKISALTGLNLIFNHENDGVVIEQSPEPMTHIEKKNPINIFLTSNERKKKSTTDYEKINLVGVPLRKAIAYLNAYSIKSKVIGRGIVIKQRWEIDSNKSRLCILECN